MKTTNLHLKKLIKKHPQIKKQFIYSSLEKKFRKITKLDPLDEQKKSPIKNLVHRYKNRVLILLTLQCAAYCRFCTRRNNFNDSRKQELSQQDIKNILQYIKKHPFVKEILISGGDALINPKLLKQLLIQIKKIPQIKIIRIATRLPVSNPKLINEETLDALKIIKKYPVYIMAHFEHPAEITPATIKAIKKLQTVSTMVLSQSVFLKGINDNTNTLYNLFSKLIEIGVKPYYLFHCDAVTGAGHFIVDLKKERKIFQSLKHKLSGLAVPHYVIDTPQGKKII